MSEYDMATVHAAAHFIWYNNTYVKSWANNLPDVVKYITEFINDSACAASYSLKNLIKENKDTDRWYYGLGTGGFYVTWTILDQTDEIVTIEAEILVDPSVSWPWPRGTVNKIVNTI